jgi:uncharacterized membrane protein
MLTGLKSISELRATARAALKGNWGKSILAVVIYAILTALLNSGSQIKAISWIIPILTFVLNGAWSAGLLTYFIHVIRKETLSLKLLFSQLQRLIPFFILILLQAIFILLWTLLLIIPGIIASLRYSQSLYILIDNPDMKASEVINRSKAMMQGQKWKYFLLHLSFIGWYLLCIPTLFIGLLWLVPYVYATQASFYEDLRLKYEEQQAESRISTI